MHLGSFFEQTQVGSEHSLSGLLYHSSWRTYSTCLRDDGERNLLLAVLTKTDRNGSMIFKSGDCAGQGRPSASSRLGLKHFRVYVWANCRLEKLHHCYETTAGPQDVRGYLNCPRSHLE
jgi:hypothetical protein